MPRALGELDNRQRVLDAAHIDRVIGEHLTLKAKGREFVCVCPFHNDHNPSMYVIPAKQIFHCFVCGAGGNAIDFVMRYHGLAFMDALEFLASKSGIELVRAPRRAGDAPQTASSRESLIEANAAAHRFFQGLLAHPQHGAAARDVIAQRGISPEMVQLFGLGAAPDRWDGLVQFATSKDIALPALIDTGLVKRRKESDGCYDLLRHRLIFPIFDRIGRPVAFGGRKIRAEDEPKYLNSPESIVFDKGATLFGLPQAIKAIQESRTAVITEGYTDVIACHQAGFRNVVATLGTAFTPKHAAALRTIADRLVLLFDGDEAGQRAADRAVDIVFNGGFEVRIASIVGGKDPDELLKHEDGADEFRGVLSRACSWVDHWHANLARRLQSQDAAPGTDRCAQIIASEFDRWFELGFASLEPLRRDSIKRRLHLLSGSGARVFEEAIEAARARHQSRSRGSRNIQLQGPSGPTPAAGAGSASGTARRSEIELAFACMLSAPDLAESQPSAARDILSMGAYGPRSLSVLCEAYSRLWTQADERAPGLSQLLLHVDDPEARELAIALDAHVTRLTDGQEDRVRGTWQSCVRRAESIRAAATPASSLSSGSPEDGAGPVVGAASRDLAAPAPDSMDAVVARLAQRRAEHERHGGDPRAFPKLRPAPA